MKEIKWKYKKKIENKQRKKIKIDTSKNFIEKTPKKRKNNKENKRPDIKHYFNEEKVEKNNQNNKNQ